MRRYQIEKSLKAFFADCTDLKMKGPEAKKLLAELKEADYERKR